MTCRPAYSLVLALASLALFPLGIAIMEQSREWLPTLKVALPALGLGIGSLIAGQRIFKRNPSGWTYGLAMTGSLTGVFSIVFWMVMVPMLLLIATPARQADVENSDLAQSEQQMLIIIRHLKTFHRDMGRLPVKVEELTEKGYMQNHNLYDPRQTRRDAVSYRLMVNEMPPEQAWADIPVLEGRIADQEGYRLCAFLNETIGRIPPPGTSP